MIGCLILIAISLTASATHFIVGAAAPTDIGGKQMAGFAAGVIDSFPSYGAAISLAITGRVLDATKAHMGGRSGMASLRHSASWGALPCGL
ncbi:MAG: hypothetical protein O3B24_04900 [Verrucomicrobia bacterium]|nr:hypothetical protein [Verrucomicrobiota bacterium]